MSYTKYSNTNIELNKNAFFLHSFLDENIGSEKGNDSLSTIHEFIRHAPEPFKSNFRDAISFTENIDSINNKILTAQCMVETNGYKNTRRYDDDRDRIRSCTYSYELESRRSNGSTDSAHTIKNGDRTFLKHLWSNAYMSTKNFPEEFSSDYIQMDYFLDINNEKIIDDEINNIINSAVTKSKSTPVFFPVGYSKHLVGLLITDKYVIITNSGQGLSHHKTYKPISDKNVINVPLIKVTSDSEYKTDTQIEDIQKNRGMDTIAILEELHKPTKKKVIQELPKESVFAFSKEDLNKPTKKKVIQELPKESVFAFSKEDLNKPTKKKVIQKLPEEPVSAFNKIDTTAFLEELHNPVENANMPSDVQSVENLPAYPQCALYLLRPDDDILKKILKEFIQISTVYTNTDINSTYAIVYKLYFLHLIRENNYTEKVLKLMEEFSKEFITNNHLASNISIKDINTYEFNFSTILKPAWIHPEYHENVMYNIDVDYRSTLHKLKDIVTEHTLKEIFDGEKNINIGEIGDNIIKTIEYDNLYNILRDLTGSGNDPINKIVLSNISTVIRTRKLYRSPESDKAYFAKIYDEIEYTVVENVLNGKYPDNMKEMIEKIVPSNYSSYRSTYEEVEAIKKRLRQSEDVQKIINSELEEKIKEKMSLEFTETHVASLRDMLSKNLHSSIVEEIEDAIKDSRDYNLINVIKEKTDVLQSDINNIATKNGFSRFKHYSYLTDRSLIDLELFCDILLHESVISDTVIKVNKNNKMFLDSYANKLESDGDSPIKLLLTKIKKQIPDLYAKISHRKIDSAFPHNFYVREQFAGSCTFNGTILALSLLGSHDIARNPETPLIVYQKEYDILKRSIQDSQLKDIESMLSSKDSKLHNNDRLVIDALETLYDREKRDKSLINNMRQKLPEQNILNVEVTFNKGVIPEENLDVSNLYLQIGPLETLSSVVAALDIVADIINKKKYIDHCFIRYVMNPIIRWILTFESTRKDINNTMHQILTKIGDVIKLEKEKMENERPRDTMGLYMLGLYIIFKTIEMKKIFLEKAIDDNITHYKSTRAENEYLINNMYLMTTMDQDILIDFCKIMDRYQFLILVKDHEHDIIHHANLMPLSGTEFDFIREYGRFQDLDEIVLLNEIIKKSILGNNSPIKIGEIINVNNYSNWLDRLIESKESEAKLEKEKYTDKYTDKYKIGWGSYFNVSTNIEREDNATHVCILLTPSLGHENDAITLMVKNKDDKLCLVYPKNNHVIFKLTDLPMPYSNYTEINIIFSSKVKIVKAYQFAILESMTEADIYTVTKRDSNIDTVCINKYKYLPQANIIDIIKLNHMIMNGKYEEVRRYAETIAIKTLDSSRNEWKYKDNFYLPILQNINSADVGKLSILSNDSKKYDDNTEYRFYNTHQIASYYKTQFHEMYEAVKNVKLPGSVHDVIQRLRVLIGDLDDYVVKKEERYRYGSYDYVDNTENRLSIRWGDISKKNTYKFTSKTSDPKSLTEDGKYVFQIGEDNKTKHFVYDNKNKQIFINEYRLMTETELDQIITSYEPILKTKNIQMIKNMVYYAKGISNFVIGLNSDFSSGIIAFTPKTTEYYEHYFYDSPWTEITKKNEYTDTHFELERMNNDASQFMWVTFDTDTFNSAIPVLGSNIVSSQDNYMLTFTLFCEYLMIEGKHELFNLLIPQLVSCYFSVDMLKGKYSYSNLELFNKHKTLIDFMLQNEYMISPYRYYYLNKLKLLVNGSYDLMTLYEFLKRQEYYAPSFQKFDDVVDLLDILRTNTSDMQFYTKWVESYNTISMSGNKTIKQELINSVNGILTDMENSGIKEHMIDVSEIVKYPNMLAYICYKKNFESMTQSLQLNILQNVKNILENLVKDETEIIGNIKYFINETFDHTNTDSIANVIKLFELINGKILDKVQYSFVLNMINDDKQRMYNVHELLMGRGKTFVIIPCVMFCYMMIGSYYNIIDCLPNHLVNQSMRVMNKISPFIINGSIVKAKSDRNSPLNSELTKVINLTSRKIIVIDDISIKSYLLSQAETGGNDTNDESEARQNEMVGGVYINIDEVQNVLMNIIKNQNSKTNAQMMERIGDFNKTEYSALRDNTLIIMDEFDSLIDPLKSDLNYPYGNQKNLDHQIILNKLVVSVTEMLFIKYRNYMLYSDRADNKINKLMIRSVMNSIDINTYSMLHKIYSDLSAKVVETNEYTIEQFKNLNSDEDIKIKNSQKGGRKQLSKSSGKHLSKSSRQHVSKNKQKGGSVDSLMMFFIREVYATYVTCMEMMLDKDYGWDDSNNENPYVVIPYSAQKSPMKGSKFSSAIINIVLTTISYFSKLFRNLDSDNLTNYIRFLVTSSSKDYVINEKNLDDIGVSLALMQDNTAFSSHMQKLKESSPKGYHDYIRMYLEELILMKYVTVDPDIYNCSFIDVIDPNFIKSKFALSGTVNVHLPEFNYYGKFDKLSSVKEDKITKDKIEKVLVGNNLLAKPTETLMLEDLYVPKDIRNTSDLPTEIGIIINKLDDGNYNIVYSIIALLGNNNNESENYNVIIDVGSFLRNYENYEFALLVSHFYKDRHVVFFDTNDQPVAMLNIKIVPFNMKTLKHDLKTKVIFDQKHTIGTDLDLHSLSRGILTVNNMTTRSPLVQGAFRFREADLRQEFTYLAKDVRQTTTELINNINKREKESFVKSEIKFYQQTVLCLLRRYDMYSKKSYQFKSFIPSIEMSDEIFNKGKYNHDYKKEEFTKYVMDCIEYVDNKLKQSESSEVNMKDNMRDAIKNEILSYLKKINESDYEDNSLMVQKQTNVQREQTYQSETESNNSRMDFRNPELIFDNICIYDMDLKPTSYEVNIQFDDRIEVGDMMKQLKYYKIYLSPNAAYSICRTYRDGETNDIFYLKFIGSGPETQVMLYTSIDIIILYSHNQSILNDIVKVNKFEIDMDNEKSFYQNFIMFLLLKIPNTKTMEYFEHNEKIKSISSIIGSHYKDAFRYNIRSISKRFADFIGLE
jgi:hypothetical protein